MKRYIKTNNDNQIIKIFTWHTRPEFDGSEILYDDNWPEQGLLVNEKNILNEFETPVFTWDGSSATERTQDDIDSDSDFIVYYKQLKKDELQAYIGLNTLDILPNHTWTEIVTQWESFKENASNWTTKQEIDTVFNNAISWLTS